MNKFNPAKNPQLSVKVREFLNALNAAGGPGLETLSPAAAREVLVGAQQASPMELPACDVEEKRIIESGIEVLFYVVRSKNVATPSLGQLAPAFIFVHGGGWVLGDFGTHERFVRDLVAKSGYTAIFVEYSRSPEVKYPTALNEIYAATEWLREHGGTLGIDSSRLAIVGNSAGGNMAASTALRVQHQQAPQFKCQVLFWPVTNADFETQSYEEFESGYFLTRAMMKWFWNSYTENTMQQSEVYASPLRASIEQLEGLPPTLVQVAGADVLRDEGIAYARKLDTAGVDVTLVRYDQLIHDYGLLNALSTLPAVQDALDQASSFLKKYLG